MRSGESIRFRSLRVRSGRFAITAFQGLFHHSGHVFRCDQFHALVILDSFAPSRIADFKSVVRYLAAAPSRLLVVSMEDVLAIKDQVNLPGTIDQHPNWRQRLPVALEELRGHENLMSLAEIMRSCGRNC